MACFDIPEPTVRVVVTRLRRDHWLNSRREGREIICSLTDAGWQLLDDGRERIFDRAAVQWTGQWSMVIYSVPEADRALRDRLRKKLAWFGFGPLSSSVWISPHDRLDAVRRAFMGEAKIQLDLFRSQSPVGGSDDRDIACRAWDLAQLNQDYASLLGTYQPRLSRYRAGTLSGSAALVERMHLVNDYRRFPFRDPDLPLELLPPEWLGRRAHEVFIAAHGLLRTPAEEAVDNLLRDPSAHGSREVIISAEN
jgi:phenylacetic acid degradation operon negative regulatory protein